MLKIVFFLLGLLGLIRSLVPNHEFKKNAARHNDDTYLTKDPSFEPEEEIEGLSLFEGL